jgi:hypothetical protein
VSELSQWRFEHGTTWFLPVGTFGRRFAREQIWTKEPLLQWNEQGVVNERACVSWGMRLSLGQQTRGRRKMEQVLLNMLFRSLSETTTKLLLAP